MADIVIFGAGGHARETAQLLADLRRAGADWHLRGFIADAGATARIARPLPGPLLGGIEWLVAHPEVQAVIAIGDPAGRRAVAERIRSHCPSVRFATLIHPRAWLADTAAVEEGGVIFAGALVNADVRLGAHVILNLGCTVSHDARLGDFVSLGPGAHLAGGVVIGDGVDFGTGAVCRPDVRIGAAAVIGAGAAVVSDLPPGCVAFGVPARYTARP